MKRRLTAVVGLAIGVTGIVVFLWTIWLYWAGMKLAGFVLRPGSGEVAPLVRQIQQQVAPARRVIEILPNNDATLQLKAITEIVDRLDVLLGINASREYVVLLQNNMELRPTGGFMGSYAVLRLEAGQLKEVRIEDIYTPDGQIKGYVPEPEPISKYLFNEGTPGWRLRDANWHPDFVEAAKAIEWFFREGQLNKPDGFLAVTLDPLVELLKRTGELKLTDYGGLVINADNFYDQAQSHAETDFFPGSTQKRDFLGSVTKQMMLMIAEDSKLAPLVIQGVMEALIRKELSVYIPDVTGSSWHQIGWDGSLRQSQSDFLMINEANLGINKANCCIRRQMTDEIGLTENGEVRHRLTLNYVNDNPTAPQPPYFWGGGYKNYIRIIVPKESQLETVTIDGQTVLETEIEVEDFEHHRAFGFLSTVAGGGRSDVKVSYRVPVAAENYSLLVQKQTGVREWPVTITAGKTMIKKNMIKDEVWKMNL